MENVRDAVDRRLGSTKASAANNVRVERKKWCINEYRNKLENNTDDGASRARTLGVVLRAVGRSDDAR